MHCPFFEIIQNTGICNASKDCHIPGIDWMSRLCFKDDFAVCQIFKKADGCTAAQRSDGKRALLRMISVSDLRPKAAVMSRQ